MNANRYFVSPGEERELAQMVVILFSSEGAASVNAASSRVRLDRPVSEETLLQALERIFREMEKQGLISCRLTEDEIRQTPYRDRPFTKIGV